MSQTCTSAACHVRNAAFPKRDGCAMGGVFVVISSIASSMVTTAFVVLEVSVRTQQDPTGVCSNGSERSFPLTALFTASINSIRYL